MVPDLYTASKAGTPVYWSGGIYGGLNRSAVEFRKVGPYVYTPRKVVFVESVKRYLGDGLYASYDGWHIVLEASNGVETSNVVYLEPAVYSNLLLYVKLLREHQAQQADPQSKQDPPKVP